MDQKEAEFGANSDPSQSLGQISHLALDIGGSLIKLVYFCKSSAGGDDDSCVETERSEKSERLGVSNGGSNTNRPILEGRIHFAKFETSKIDDCLEFISSKKLHCGGLHHMKNHTYRKTLIKATGGGAHKFANLVKEKLGIGLDKEDEMDCLVAGANFLLKAVQNEAYTYTNDRKEFMQIDQNDLYPYLLVNIGSGVSMIKVDGDGKFERVSGTNVGGGTFWGLGRLLTKCKNFDELLELSYQGNNRVVDMLVGDIYGGMDYSKVGLVSTAIASSFGKAISDIKELEDYKPEDISRSLLRMISNNIGQISYLNALRFGIKRIFFGGFFIRGHPFTMDTLSVGVDFWSKGEAKALFLRHEGFLGALGAFVSYHKQSVDDLAADQVVQLPVAALCSADMSCNALNGESNENESIQCSVYAV